jgi:hypothetical protein
VTGQHPAPGHDESAVPTPAARVLCTSLQHYRESRPARGVVRFGDQGSRYPEAIWPDCWHDTCPACPVCWQAPAQQRPARPGYPAS